MRRMVWLGWALLAVGCGSEGPVSAGGGAPQASLAGLSDEFDDAKTLGDWQRVEKVEGWGNDQIESLGIQKGWLTVVPRTSTWYRDYRGILLFKPVSGDFVVTTRMMANRRSGTGAPRSKFSLAGIMVRTPRKITPQSWQPGGENYVFLSLGAGDQPGNYQLEVKTTVASDSQLSLTPAAGGEALIRVARIGGSVITLVREGGAWRVHRRYARPDFPATLQAGLTCYTDWDNASKLQPAAHNAATIREGAPDLVASFDYVRYARPEVPSELVGKRLDDPGAVSDAVLLRFLGDSVP